MGYAWRTKFRIVPETGTEETIDLVTAIARTRGPISVKPKYTPDLQTEENVNREVIQRNFGWKVEVEIDFEVLGDMSDHAPLVRILNALMRPDHAVYLSLDNGTVYRQVLLSGCKGPEAIKGRTHAGAKYEITLRCKEPVTELVPIGSGSW